MSSGMHDIGIDIELVIALALQPTLLNRPVVPAFCQETKSQSDDPSMRRDMDWPAVSKVIDRTSAQT